MHNPPVASSSFGPDTGKQESHLFQRSSQRVSLKDDSDDEHPIGPPKLSNFGSALLFDKENHTPTGTRLQRDPAAADLRKSVAFQDISTGCQRPSQAPLSRNLSLNSMSNTNNTFGASYPSYNSEDPSQSTLFTTSRHQPSMTTVHPEPHGLDSSKSEQSSHRLRTLQHSLKEELSSRHAKRRNRRFVSSRLGLLGPAKRASSTAGLAYTDSGNDDASISQQEANVSGSSSTSGFVGNNEGYNVFLESHTGAAERRHHTPSKDSGVDYRDVDFGDLNPYQYLKKHNLPTSELPNISKIYFERQKEENRRTALRKNVVTRETLHERVASMPNVSFGAALQQREYAGASTSTSTNISNSASNSNITTRQPRRKASDTPSSAFSKSLSSPLTTSNSSTYAVAATAAKHPYIDHPQQKYDTPPATDTPIHKKREALANIDTNSQRHSHAQTKMHRSSAASLRNEVHQHRQQQLGSQQEFLHRRAPPPPPPPPSLPTDSDRRGGLTKAARVETVPLKPPATGSLESQASLDPHARRKPTIQVNGTEYEKMELLGRGGSSKVYKVRTPNNKVYALKRVAFDEFDESSVDGFKGEIELLKKLENQPRVVRLVDYEMAHGVLFVVMECGDHDLSSILAHRASLPLDIEFVRYHAQEMLRCVKVVHDADIVHSDLKPANFVFVKGILKIIDFGIANAVPDHTVNIYRETQIGTPNYMAPEALVAMNYAQGQPHQQNRWKVGKPSDIWSCGCILYQMIYGRPPYGGFQGQNRLLAIMNPEVKIVYPEKTPSGDVVPRTALDTMKACLERNPDKRCTVDEVLNGAFIRPVSVTHFFVRDLIKNAVKYGSEQREVSSEKVEELADDVWNRLAEFRL